MASSNVKVYFLDRYGVTLKGLRKLGSRKVTLHAYLRRPEPKTLFRYSPPERLEKVRAWYERQAREAVRGWPGTTCAVQRSSTPPYRPYAVVDVLAAASVHLLPPISELDSIWIDGIDGLQAAKGKPSLGWFTVHARVAVQVEGQTQGMQTYEERFMTVKAMNFEDAERKVRPEFKAYAEPYLNSDGEMVRWQLEEVVDVYEMYDGPFTGGSVEVFSMLKKRRMRPNLVWKPRSKR